MASRARRASRAARIAFLLMSGTVTLALAALALLRPGQTEAAWLTLEAGRVPVARDAATLSLLEEAVRRHDPMLVETLETEGLVFRVARYRRVAILARPPADPDSVAVRIQEGAQRGRTGWVSIGWLGFVPPDPPRS